MSNETMQVHPIQLPRVPKKAFVLAAGLGERMRPLTDNCPKPLIEVGGRTMLDRTLDRLAAVGVEEAVVNVHYLPEMIATRLAARAAEGLGPRVILSREESRLDTGGGVQKALSFFEGEAFFVLNADVVWTDGAEPAFTALARAWNGDDMDVLLLLHPAEGLPDDAGSGDYYLAEDMGRPVFRTGSAVPANFVFTGARIVHPRAFAGMPSGAFSFLDVFHKAEAAGRLFALRHAGGWHHVGTPDAVMRTNAALAGEDGALKAVAGGYDG